MSALSEETYQRLWDVLQTVDVSKTVDYVEEIYACLAERESDHGLLDLRAKIMKLESVLDGITYMGYEDYNPPEEDIFELAQELEDEMYEVVKYAKKTLEAMRKITEAAAYDPALE